MENENYYTNVRTSGNFVLFRGVVDGERVIKKIKYKPSLYIPTNEETGYKTLFGDNVSKKTFSDINECRDFLQKYKNVEGFEFYGNANFEYAFIADYFNKDIHFDFNKFRIFDYDIETDSSDGFPDPVMADKAILTITITVNKGKVYCWSYKDYEPKDGEIFHRCSDEFDLLNRVLAFWKSDYPDILTGWNTSLYDDVFLINRCRKILGEKLTNQFSPFGIIRERTKKGKFENDEQTYDIYGISQVDYLKLYKLFAKDGNRRENYKLNTIANIELNKSKVEYKDEYDNLAKLYDENHQLFLEYNIEDVKLVDELDNKLQLLELALTLAYDTHSNLEDVFTQTRMWDSNINCYLINKNIVIPQKKEREKKPFVGGFVKPPQCGKFGCVASFDLNSLLTIR